MNASIPGIDIMAAAAAMIAVMPAIASAKLPSAGRTAVIGIFENTIIATLSAVATDTIASADCRTVLLSILLIRANTPTRPVMIRRIEPATIRAPFTSLFILDINLKRSDMAVIVRIISATALVLEVERALTIADIIAFATFPAAPTISSA